MALQESQLLSNADNGITSSTFWVAQTWTTVSAYSITGIRLGFFRLAATGDTVVTVSIRATDVNDKPTGGDLASFTFDGDTLTTDESGEWVTRNFDAPYSLDSGVIYAIVIRRTGTLNLRYRRKSLNVYAGGALHTSSDSGSTWGDASTTDVKFAIYGDPPLPGKPTTPSPSDAASDITLDETPLSWVSGGDTDTYEIYFREQGDSWDLVGVAQAGTSWAVSFGTLAYGITYEWRIDATNTVGTTTGDTWNFSSIDFDEIQISYRLISGGNGNGPYASTPGVQGTDWEWTGENNMLTVRKLVVAANNKIWHEDI